MSSYRGRFAPSPTGPLHAGSLVAALASWLDARAAGGAWLVRIEDVDTPRCVPGADELILSQLAACGLVPDEPPLWQSRRGSLYAAALQRLSVNRDTDAPLGGLSPIDRPVLPSDRISDKATMMAQEGGRAGASSANSGSPLGQSPAALTPVVPPSLASATSTPSASAIWRSTIRDALPAPRSNSAR